MELWDIYNKQREKTGRTHVRGQPLQDSDFHLVVHIWIKNSSGQFLIQKRPPHTKWMPNMWAATGGAVVSGEDTHTGAARETEEELGVRISKEKFYLLFSETRDQDITDIWMTHCDLPLSSFNPLQEEVTEIEWASPTKIREMIQNKIFVDYGEYYFTQLGLI